MVAYSVVRAIAVALSASSTVTSVRVTREGAATDELTEQQENSGNELSIPQRHDDEGAATDELTKNPDIAQEAQPLAKMSKSQKNKPKKQRRKQRKQAAKAEQQQAIEESLRKEVDTELEPQQEEPATQPGFVAAYFAKLRCDLIDNPTDTLAEWETCLASPCAAGFLDTAVDWIRNNPAKVLLEVDDIDQKIKDGVVDEWYNDMMEVLDKHKEAKERIFAVIKEKATHFLSKHVNEIGQTLGNFFKEKLANVAIAPDIVSVEAKVGAAWAPGHR